VLLCEIRDLQVVRLCSKQSYRTSKIFTCTEIISRLEDSDDLRHWWSKQQKRFMCCLLSARQRAFNRRM